jgi:membrane-associated phospholipid phosphatase
MRRIAIISTSISRRAATSSRSALLSVISLVALTTPARADRSDKVRAIHGASLVGFGVGYLAVEFLLKEKLIPETCKWCDPPGLDTSIRDGLKWDDVRRADIISDVTGYYSAPAVTMGLLVASTWNDRDWRRWFDDTVPVLQSAIFCSVLHHVTKFSVGRRRPFVRFPDEGFEPGTDDEMSFWSGHTSLAFSLAVSAGVVAHQRDYAVEPAVWIAGLTLATATGYLRIAADQHYFTDVLVGAVVGSAIGVAVPLLLHRDTLVTVDATPRTLSFAGTF